MGVDHAIENKKYTATIDVAKVFFALLVVGIHTEPFGFSFLLDKGFGILTRLCVPFFFVTSSYFFFLKDRNPFQYVKRLFFLYAIWCVIYLPLHFAEVKEMTAFELVIHYFWTGHSILWYLSGSIIGFLITYGLSKLVNSKTVLYIGIVVLVLGCLQSTYAGLLEKVLPIDIPDTLSGRNGLFYGFPYYALGLAIAKKDTADYPSKRGCCIGMTICFVLLFVETMFFVIVLNAKHTILWLSVFPLTYYLFMFLKQVTILLPQKTSFMIRRISTLIYVIHPIFMWVFGDCTYLMYFATVAVTSLLASCILVYLSDKRACKWLRVLY